MINNEQNGTVEEIKNPIQQTQNNEAQNVNESSNQINQTQNIPQNFQQQNMKVYYDSDGRPIFSANINNNSANNSALPKKPERKPRVGQFIAAIITLIIGIGFTAFSTYYFFSVFIPANSEGSDFKSALTFILYLISGLGILIGFPGFALSIASLVCSCFSVHSSKKGIKIVSGFIIFFSILTIVIGLALPFILLISSSST